MVSVAATVVLVVGSSTLLGGILDGSGARLSLVVTTRGSRGGKDMTTGSDLGVGSGSSCPFPGLPGCGGLILVVVAVAVTLAPSAASGFELEFAAAAAFSLLLAIAVAAKPEGWSKDLGGSGFILDNADRKALKRQRGEKKRGRGQEHVTVKKRYLMKPLPGSILRLLRPFWGCLTSLVLLISSLKNCLTCQIKCQTKSKH